MTMSPALVRHIDSLQWLRSLPGRPTVVAEIKPRSPFSGWINLRSISDQLAICEAVGDVISVHTDEMWGGSWDLLWSIAKRTNKEVLAKGFHPTIHHVKKALDECAADWCLTVGWHPAEWSHAELRSRCWFEAESNGQIQTSTMERVVCNTRDPRTGEARHSAQAVIARTLRTGWLCQASHIRGPQDVVEGMNAILIGEGLYRHTGNSDPA